MRITVKDPPKVFDDRKFFREEGLIAFRQPPNSQTTTQFHLRNPQKEALLKMRDTLMSTEEKNFLVVLPTGVGKTLLIALAPFALDVSQKVLVLTPTVWLKRQIKDKLEETYDKNVHPIGFTGKVEARVGEYDGRSLEDTRLDVIVANVQQFVRGDSVKERAREQLAQIKIDLVLIDEGHHSAASTWQLIQNEVMEKNPEAKFVFFTATPKRTDGVNFGITDKDQFYLCTRKDAEKAKYIKETRPEEVVLDEKLVTEFKGKQRKKLFTDPRLAK